MNPFWLGNPAGVGQQTRAAQILIAGAAGNGVRGVRRKRKASRKTAPRARRASPAKRATRRGKTPRLVKGSAAAKAYMAKIRRKRRR
jgi:hypothetical protein